MKAMAPEATSTLLDALLATAPDAVLIAASDGTIVLCNQRAQELFGWENCAAWRDRPLTALLAPEAPPHLGQLIRRKPITGLELAMVRHDGTPFDAQVWTSSIPASASILAEARTILFVRDITASRAAVSAIRRHNQELTVLNNIAVQATQTYAIPDMLADILDQTLDAVRADTGWIEIFKSGAPAIGTSHLVTRGLPPVPETAEPCADLRARVAAQVRTAGKPYVILADDQVGRCLGIDVPSQLLGVPLITRDRVRGVLVVVGLLHHQPHPLRLDQVQLLAAIGHQISTAVENARLAAQAAEVDMLREVDRIRSELLASFSHDLRSPLGLIEMTCSTLLRDDVHLDADSRDELLRDVRAQIGRLTKLVDGILALEQLESGHLTLKRMPLDLRDLLRGSVQQARSVSSHHRITLDLPADPLAVLADADRIEQVLHNLIDNAVKYSPNGGEIGIRGRRADRRIRIDVTDAGLGIPEDQRGLIFERFYRIERDAARHVSGAGLGLAICKGIVEAHGGAIWSVPAPEGGSTFCFELPTAPMELQ